MTNLKKYLIQFSITIISIIVSLLVLTIFYNYNIINASTFNILKLLFLLLSLFIISFILGKKTKNKGYLEGIKLSTFIILLFLIISLFTKSLKFKSIIYYIIIFTTSLFGSMLGINRKKEL